MGWISDDRVFTTQNRNLFEYSLVQNNDPKNLVINFEKLHELPFPPEDIIWLDNSSFVSLADVGGTTPSLYLHNVENLASFKQFETNGEWVKQLKKLDGNSFAAFCKSGKVLTYTLSKSLAN